jgi:L-seryl-tRNA(Ser) seleniumtransferase
VSAPELAEIGREFSLPVVVDVGSGNFISLPALWGQSEPTVQAIVSSGADVVTFSGDKLLGGPKRVL